MDCESKDHLFHREGYLAVRQLDLGCSLLSWLECFLETQYKKTESVLVLARLTFVGTTLFDILEGGNHEIFVRFVSLSATGTGEMTIHYD